MIAYLLGELIFSTQDINYCILCDLKKFVPIYKSMSFIFTFLTMFFAVIKFNLAQFTQLFILYNDFAKCS